MLGSVRLSLALTGSAALALAYTPIAISPVGAEETEPAKETGVLDLNLRDAVKLNYGFQGQLQGAGTPNEAGLGAFIPLNVGKIALPL